MPPTEMPTPRLTPTATPALQLCPSEICAIKIDYTNDGICDSDCSIREAIQAAASSDTIFIPAGAYIVTGRSLTFDKEFKFNDAGAEPTVIQAATVPGVAFNRIFTIETNRAPVSISGVTIRNGRAVGGLGGRFWAGAGLELINGNTAEFPTFGG